MIPIAYYVFIATPCIIGGIVLQYIYDFSWIISAFIIIGSACAGFCAWYMQPKLHLFLVIGAYSILCSGIGMLCYQYQWYAFNTFHATMPTHRCTITGTISAIEPVEHLRTPYRITLHTTTLNTENATKKLQADIWVYSTHGVDIRVGDTVQLQNARIKKPLDVDFTRYLVKEGIYATIFANITVANIIDHPSWSITRWITEKRAQLFNTIRAKLSSDTFALYSALFWATAPSTKKKLIRSIYSSSGGESHMCTPAQACILGLLYLPAFALCAYCQFPI